MRIPLEISQETFETIARYLEKQMSPEEMSRFEEQIKADEGLLQKTEEVRLLLLGVEEASVIKTVKKFHGELPAVRSLGNRKKNGTIRAWLIAASVALLAGVSLWLLFGAETANEKLFADYYRHDPGLLTAMSSSDNFDFERAMVDYKTGDYTAAVAVWSRLLAARPDSDTLNYFMGAASLAVDDPAAARAYFQKAADQEQSVFAPDANWYIGLALIKMDSTHAAIAFIERSDHPRKEALLQRLKE